MFFYENILCWHVWKQALCPKHFTLQLPTVLLLKLNCQYFHKVNSDNNKSASKKVYDEINDNWQVSYIFVVKVTDEWYFVFSTLGPLKNT